MSESRLYCLQLLCFNLAFVKRQCFRAGKLYAVACRYCASHQEMREAIVRGLDGPGMSPLDVHPASWRHVEGFEAEMEHRQRRLAQLQVWRLLLELS